MNYHQIVIENTIVNIDAGLCDHNFLSSDTFQVTFIAHLLSLECCVSCTGIFYKTPTTPQSIRLLNFG